MINSVKEILSSEDFIAKKILVAGWVKTFRANRFISLNDGSTINNLQCVIDFEKYNDEFLKKISTGSAIQINGKVVESQGSKQSVEVLVSEIIILGESDPDDYPIQPKKHSLEFLRSVSHLRTRTTTFSSVMRIRSSLSYAIHTFFQKNGFYYVNTPIITASDAEGAGEQFKVTTLNSKRFKNNDHSDDFFGKETKLTVSGQLEAESYAMSMGKVYTFGPTFRAENSNTSRHLSEFWMVEPEVAFLDLNGNMDLAEKFLKYTIDYILVKNKEDLQFLEKRLIDEDKLKPKEKRNELSLIEKLNFIVNNNFKKITYDQAFEILKNCKPNKKKKFKYLITEWGNDLQSEHERYLVEKHFKSPVIIYNYPAKIKSFYMKLNSDNKTVRAMDILFPGIGEIVGGSQREENHDILLKRMYEFKIEKKELWWYLDLRKFGSAVHSGFGLGFERLVMFVTGMSNIRDVIPFPRTPQNAEF
jgi:asparaginyl-tRNA synthetase